VAPWTIDNLLSRQRIRTGALLATAAGVGGVAGVGLGITPAAAQSPVAQWRMQDTAPGGSYPQGANAVVVEGLGVFGGCADGSRYSVNAIKRATLNYINTSTQVIDEITPQPICASAGAYKNLVKSLTNYLYANVPSSRVNRYWGGFMFDDEVSYGGGDRGYSKASTYSAINKSARAALNSHGASGARGVYGEDGTASWGVSAYKTIMHSALPAPQAYGSGQVSFINNRCYSGYNCLNLVTIGTSRPSPYNNYNNTQGQITGQAPYIWEFGGSQAWYNKFQPV